MSSWFDQIGGILQQYASNNSQATESTEQDFENAANLAPKDALASGIADSFRSDQTAPFPNMLGQIFGNSNGTQQASLLNMLIGAAGPALLSGLTQRGGGGALGGLGNLGNLGNLGSLLQGGGGQISPQDAQKLNPQEVEELARVAEQQDPGIIDRLGQFYAEHPGLVKSLGAAALAVAMSGMAKQKRGLL